MTYSDEKYSSKLGVDVSKFQGDIDWAVVAEESDVSWTMLRLGYRGYSEGKLALDSTFTANAAGDMENNIDIGIYFFTQAVNYEEGVEEAEFVLSNIADIDVKYPIVIDTEEMEADNARANGISNSDRTDAIVGFCETIKAAGYTPMIYANRNWYAESLDMDRLGDYGLWLAQYSNVPDFPYMFSAWQYTPYGSVPGITGDVDLDIWIE
jgi:GH25 family lysozyme M1 (1,4-beta-N-acetylmuramidase)